MGWSIGYKLPKEPELLDELLAGGKALYLASAFESKCRYVLWIAKLTHHFEQTGDSSATWELMQALKDKLPGSTIGELKGFPEIKPIWEGLMISPCLPSDWENLNLVRKFRNCTYKINIQKQRGGMLV